MQQVVLEADRVEPLDNGVPDHFADGRRRCAASQGRGDDGGQAPPGAITGRAAPKALTSVPNTTAETLETSSRVTRSRRGRPGRDLDRIPIDCSQLPDDGVMTGH